MDKDFSSGSLMGWVLEFLLLALRCKTCRAIRPPRAAQPRRGLPAEQRPGPPAPTRGVTCRYPLTHPPPHSSVNPIGGVAGLRVAAARRPAHPTLDRPGGHLEDLAVACRTRPQSGWPPTSARVRPLDTRPDTVSADQSPLRTPGSRWPGDGHGGPVDRPVGRTSPVRGDRPATGSGPGPDSGRHLQRQASDHAAASRPRPTTRPARPGPDRTGPDRTGQDKTGRHSACSPSANLSST
jgi:hypothetical protein